MPLRISRPFAGLGMSMILGESLAPGPGAAVVNALPAKCPTCPPKVSCAPCMPWQCPTGLVVDGHPAAYHLWSDPSGSMKCVGPTPAVKECPTGFERDPASGKCAGGLVLPDSWLTGEQKKYALYGLGGLAAIALAATGVYWAMAIKAKPNRPAGGHGYRRHRRNGDWTRLRISTGWQPTPGVDPISPAQAQQMAATYERRAIAAERDAQEAWEDGNERLTEQYEAKARDYWTEAYLLRH